MSREQLQSAYPKLTELFRSRSDDNDVGGSSSFWKLKPVLGRLVASFSFSSESSSESCAKSGGFSRFLLFTPDGALLVGSVCFGVCALVLSVSILTSRPLLVRKSVLVTKGEKREVLSRSMEYRKAVRGDFAFGLGLMWVSAVLFISGMAFSTTVSFVTESLREELLACVYSFTANAGFCFLCGNIARLGIIDDREERTNLVILGTVMTTLMLVSHLFPKISEGSGKAGWFCETWSFAWCALALAANLGLNCAVEFRGGFTSWDAFYGLTSGSGAGLMYFAMASPLWLGKCFGTALFLIGFACHVLGAATRHSVTRYSTTAKEEGEEEDESVAMAKKTE